MFPIGVTHFPTSSFSTTLSYTTLGLRVGFGFSLLWVPDQKNRNQIHPLHCIIMRRALAARFGSATHFASNRNQSFFSFGSFEYDMAGLDRLNTLFVYVTPSANRWPSWV